MELVGMLRVLARHRWLLALGAVLALAAAVPTLYRVTPGLPPQIAQRGGSSVVATAQALLGAADGGSYELDSRIATTIPARASLVADLAATDVARTRIARLAGIDPGQLAIFGPATGAAAVPVPLAAEATEAGGLAPEAAVVRLQASPTQPIITIRAYAAQPAMAARLADATRAGLEDIVRARSGRAPVVQIERLGVVTQRTVVTAPKKPVAVIAFIAVLVLWCSGVILVDRLGRRPRTSRSVRRQTTSVTGP
jgi:hypothetical protein